MNKRIIIALILLLILSTYNSQKHFKFNIKFTVKEISIENNTIFSDIEIKNQLSFLYNKNIIFLKSEEINKEINNNSFIESLEIKKIFPNKLKIKIFEKNPVVILQEKKKRYYLTDKGDIINFVPINKFKSLPIAFSNKSNFLILYGELKNINFPLNLIKEYYFFESQRWDFQTKKGQIIKLPSKNYLESLENFLIIKDNQSFAKYKTFDYRIPHQLILK